MKSKPKTWECFLCGADTPHKPDPGWHWFFRMRTASGWGPEWSLPGALCAVCRKEYREHSGFPGEPFIGVTTNVGA